MSRLKPKVGVLFFTSGWFRDVGLQSTASILSKEIEIIGTEIVTRLSSFSDPVYHGVIYSEQEAIIAARMIANAAVEGLIISPLMWCEDQIVRAALTIMAKLPVLLCTFFPYPALSNYLPFQEMLKGSGSVGSLQLSGLLKREGYHFQTVTGYYRDEDIFENIRSHCLAFAIRSRLKKTICGVLAFPCNQMAATWVDDFTIRKLYGVELKYLELQRFKTKAENVLRPEIAELKQLLREKGYVIDVDELNYVEGIKFALAMEKIMAEDRLDILAMNDVSQEMHDCFGLRPGLENPRLTEAGAIVCMEADIAAGIAMDILNLFTGATPFYTEILTADLQKNAILMGHAGYHSGVNHDKKWPAAIIPDIEYNNSDRFSGACTYFKFKPGPVTAVNCVFNGVRLCFTAFEGISLPGPPMLEGNSHLFCKVEIPLSKFYQNVLEAGVSQHWIVIPGNFLKCFPMLCSWLNIDYIKL